METGSLDPQWIDESSGLETSPAFPNRLYHINDSGDAGRFYVTDLNGRNTQVVAIEGFAPMDAEDIAIGDCGLEDRLCLFVADIGDNNRVRDFVELIAVAEEDEYPDSVEPVYRLRIRYPEGPADAESLAVHPDGDLFIITKSADYASLRVQPSRIYRVPRSLWRGSGGALITADLAGEWDLSTISSDTFSGSLPTAADISDDGERLLLLTYANAFEFVIDSWERLGPTTGMAAGIDFREIEIETLEQQESAAYVPGSKGFRYETESSAAGGRPRIMLVGCRE